MKIYIEVDINYDIEAIEGGAYDVYDIADLIKREFEADRWSWSYKKNVPDDDSEDE